MTTSGSDEAALWRAALGGDGTAFTTLFRLHRRRVFVHATRLLQSDADADDVAASAFLELWRRRESVVLVEGSVLPWLLVTATNLSKNVTRGLRRYRSLLDQMPRDDGAVDPASVAALRVERLRGETPLGRAMRQLAHVDVALLTLTVLEGYSTIEAAQLTGLSVSTARSRTSRARERLRTLLSRTPTYDTFAQEPQ